MALSFELTLPQVDAQVISLSTLVADLIGVFASAWLGASTGNRRGFDLVGFMVLGMVSGVGGGLVRDTLLQAGPPLALVQPLYLLVALLGSLVAWFYVAESGPHAPVLLGLDALTLGSFAVAGTQRTLDAGLTTVPALMLGVLSAVGGGLLRDLLNRDVPRIFVPGPLYALAALGASAAALAMRPFASGPISLLVGAAVGFVLHVGSRRYKVHLPARRPPEGP